MGSRVWMGVGGTARELYEFLLSSRKMNEIVTPNEMLSSIWAARKWI